MEKTQNFKSTVFACYRGYITQGIVNNLSPLFFVLFQNKFGISYSLISALILCNFVTQVITDMLSVKYVDRIGYRKSAVIAHALAFLGLVMQGTLPNVLPAPYVGLVLATIVNGVGGGLIEVIISPIVDSCPGDAKASAMSLLHSFYCWGQVGVVLITTLLLRLIGEDLWFIIPILWSLLPLYNLFRFLKVPLMPTVPEEEKTPLKTLFTSKIFLMALLLMLCAGASELAMSQWSSLFAERALGVTKVIGDLLGPCLFAVFMGIGRTIYGVWGEKIHLTGAMVFCAALCILCYLGTAFSAFVRAVRLFRKPHVAGHVLADLRRVPERRYGDVRHFGGVGRRGLLCRPGIDGRSERCGFRQCKHRRIFPESHCGPTRFKERHAVFRGFSGIYFDRRSVDHTVS